MLTAIEIENFKSIGERQRIELAPITLLFGPNSAGKSSIFDAIHFLRERFLEEISRDESRPPLPDFLELINDSTDDWGKLKRAVTDSNFINFRLEGTAQRNSDESYDPRFEPCQSFFSDADSGQKSIESWRRLILQQVSPWDSTEPERERRKQYRRLLGSKSKLGREMSSYKTFLNLHLRDWSVDIQVNNAGVHRCEIGINGCPVVCWFRIDHPESPTDTARAITPGLREDTEVGIVCYKSVLWGVAQAYAQFRQGNGPTTDSRTLTELDEKAIERTPEAGLAYARTDLRFGKAGDSRAIQELCPVPSPGFLHPLLRGEEIADKDATWRSFAEDTFLSCQMDVVIQTVVKQMEAALSPMEQGSRDIVHVGPLRFVPSTNWIRERPVNEGTKDWYDGKAAFTGISDETVQTLNTWLDSDPTEHSRFEIKKTWTISDFELQYIQLVAGREPPGKRLEKAMRALENFDARRDLVLHQKGGISQQRSLSQVGVGLAQAVPVIAASCGEGGNYREGFIFIEQPELHLHPRLEVGIADIFARNMLLEKTGIAILETHSELLMLRFCRLIGEPDHQLQPSDLSINFLSKDTGETKITKIRIDEDGEFIDRWPQGFFEEREKELFGD